MSLLVSSGGGGPITASDITDSSASGRAVLTGTAAEGRSALGIASDVGSESLAYYVDSVLGNDDNTGRTTDAPWKTLSKVQSALDHGIHVYLKRGSYWREAISGGTVDYVTVGAYGIGPRPIIDCANTLAASDWTQETSGGATHVWRAIVTIGTTGFGSGKEQVSVRDNSATGSQMVRARKKTSIADVEATQNSFYYTGSGGTSGTLYVHTNAGTAPTDGQISYASRLHSVWLGNNCTVSDVLCRNSLHNDGSIKLGFSARILRCRSEEGSIHNFLAKDGRLEDCESYNLGNKADYGDSGAFAFYFNANVVGEISMIRCSSDYGRAVDGSIQWQGESGMSFCTAHCESGGSYSTASVSECSCRNQYGVFGITAFNRLTIEDCAFSGIASCITYVMPRYVISRRNIYTVQSGTFLTIFVSNNKTDISLENDTVIGGQDSSKGAIWLRTGSTGSTVSMYGCRFNLTSSLDGIAFNADTGSGSTILHARGNYFYGSNLQVYRKTADAAVTWDSDSNIYMSTVLFLIDESWKSLADFRTLTGAELNSIQL